MPCQLGVAMHFSGDLNGLLAFLLPSCFTVRTGAQSSPPSCCGMENAIMRDELQARSAETSSVDKLAGSLQGRSFRRPMMSINNTRNARHLFGDSCPYLPFASPTQLYRKLLLSVRFRCRVRFCFPSCSHKPGESSGTWIMSPLPVLGRFFF